MSTTVEVVIGATRKELRVPCTDGTSQNNPVDISGGSVRLQGKSADLPSKTIDVAGTIYDGPNGIARWTGLGDTGFVTTSDMGGRLSATFSLRVKFTDAAGKVDYTPAFNVMWVMPPV